MVEVQKAGIAHWSLENIKLSDRDGLLPYYREWVRVLCLKALFHPDHSIGNAVGCGNFFAQLASGI